MTGTSADWQGTTPRVMFDFAGLELTPHAGIIGLLHYVVIKAARCSLYFPQPPLLYKPQLGDINVPGCSFREWSLGWLEKAATGRSDDAGSEGARWRCLQLLLRLILIDDCMTRMH